MQSKNFAGVCLLVMLWLFMVSCNNTEISRLQVQNDSIRNALNVDHRFQVQLNEVRSLLDSIDRSTGLVLHYSDKPITFEEVSSRLAYINENIRMCEEKIHIMEDGLNASGHDVSAYSLLIVTLKDELQLRQDQISDLHEDIASYKSESESVEQKIKVTETEANNARRLLADRQKQFLLLQAKIETMAKELRDLEADAYYARARHVEEAARRTKLAPRKKRSTYEEALELYKMALFLGKDEAKVDIGALERTLHR